MSLLLIAFGLFGLLLANLAEKHSIRVSWFQWLLALVSLGVALLGPRVFSSYSPALESRDMRFDVTLLVTACLGFLLIRPKTRLLLSRWLSIRPESPVHLVSLVMSSYLLAWSLLNLFWVGGIPGLQETVETVPLWSIVIQALVFCLFAFVGVGLFTRRPWKLTLVRLGVARIPRRSMLIAAASVMGLLMVNMTVTIIWVLVNPEQVEALGQISEVLLGGVDSFGSIFMVAVCSSVSEELLFRGAMQPRFGILFTSILFALVHLQYAISPATLLILIIGIVLGVLRRQFGTWTAIFTHFGYNFSLLVLGLIATKVLESAG